MKKLVLLMLSLSLLLTACGSPSKPVSKQPVQAKTETPVVVEEEELQDCDTGDMLEGDEDCYGVDLKKTFKKKKKKKKTSSYSSKSSYTKKSYKSKRRHR